jgi:hypothetical protein
MSARWYCCFLVLLFSGTAVFWYCCFLVLLFSATAVFCYCCLLLAAVILPLTPAGMAGRSVLPYSR